MAEGYRLQSAMDEAVDTLAEAPVSSWPAWLVYMLESLEPRVQLDEYQEALHTIARDIAARLEVGRW
jgi:hypothetical protein